MMKLLFSTLLAALLATSVFAKRAAPAEVAPVTVGPLVISAPHFAVVNGVDTRGGVLEARNEQTGEIVWSVQVYKTKYKAELETDVQDVFIKTLSHDATHGLLILSDESDRVFVVDLSTRVSTPIR